jgi:hypothetical protein
VVDRTDPETGSIERKKCAHRAVINAISVSFRNLNLIAKERCGSVYQKE